ncbi:MAG: bifunctional phosphoglucose/phosphomannose isomerase [Candidatus Bathyarchaeia archaeon]
MGGGGNRIRWDPEAFLDGSGMYRNVMAFPRMLEGAVMLLGDLYKAIDSSRVRNIACNGMGGSGIGFEFVKAWLSSSLKVPLEVIRDYNIPSYVNSSTLSVSASYSGDTEETISCFVKAREAGAQSVVITSGGKLEEVARTLEVSIIRLPGGLPPRAALPYLLAPISQLLERLGFTEAKVTRMLAEAAPEVAQSLKYNNIEVAEESNEAKKLSKALCSKVPVIYGHGLTYAVALRFKQQLNENSKMFSHCNQLPELHHNEIEDFEDPFLKNYVVVLLRSRWEESWVSERFQLTAELLQGKVGEVIQFRCDGSTPVSEALSMTALLDLTTVYLALLRRVNPSIVSKIDALKSKLNSVNHFP